MAIYHIPVVLMIEADSLEEAQNSTEEWGGDLDIETDLPPGTEEIDLTPKCEYNDEGQRIVYLPSPEEIDVEDTEDEDMDEDDFIDMED